MHLRKQQCTVQSERIPERYAKYSEISGVKDNSEGDQKTPRGGSSIYSSFTGEQEWAVPSKVRKERERVPKNEIVRLEDNETAWDSTLRPEGDEEVDSVVSSML